MDLASCVALVTGGASGLGLGAARVLHAAGARVVIVDLASSDGAQIAADLGDGVRFCPADVTDEAAVLAAVEVADQMGRLAIVVNGAGIGPRMRVVADDGSPGSLATLRRILEVNLVGTFNVLRLAAAAMVRHDLPQGTEERGVIINVASAAAFDGQIGHAAYSASKGGIVGMTLPLARDLADQHIRVMTIAPGLFDTPLLAPLSTEALASMDAQVPHPRRRGTAQEFGQLVRHIVEDPMLNGSTIRLDGALRLAPR